MRKTRARRRPPDTARVRPAAALAVPAVVRARTPGCSSPITHVGRPAVHRIRARMHDETFAVWCSTQGDFDIASAFAPRLSPGCQRVLLGPSLHVGRGREVRGVARCVCVKLRVVRRGRPGAPMDGDKPQPAGADPDSGPRRAHWGRADADLLECPLRGRRAQTRGRAPGFVPASAPRRSVLPLRRRRWYH